MIRNVWMAVLAAASLCCCLTGYATETAGGSPAISGVHGGSSCVKTFHFRIIKRISQGDFIKVNQKLGPARYSIMLNNKRRAYLDSPVPVMGTRSSSSLETPINWKQVSDAVFSNRQMRVNRANTRQFSHTSH